MLLGAKKNETLQSRTLESFVPSSISLGSQQGENQKKNRYSLDDKSQESKSNVQSK
jgi:hypothetical protein